MVIVPPCESIERGGGTAGGLEFSLQREDCIGRGMGMEYVWVGSLYLGRLQKTLWCFTQSVEEGFGRVSLVLGYLAREDT